MAFAAFGYRALARELEERLEQTEADVHQLIADLETAEDNVEALRTLLGELDKKKMSKDEFADWVADGKSKINPSLEQGFENMLSYDPFQKRE